MIHFRISGPRVICIDIDAHWGCSITVRGTWTFDTDVAEGREEVGWILGMRHCVVLTNGGEMVVISMWGWVGIIWRDPQVFDL